MYRRELDEMSHEETPAYIRWRANYGVHSYQDVVDDTGYLSRKIAASVPGQANPATWVVACVVQETCTLPKSPWERASRASVVAVSFHCSKWCGERDIDDLSGCAAACQTSEGLECLQHMAHSRSSAVTNLVYKILTVDLLRCHCA